MNRNDLLECINILADMENNIYLQKVLIQDLSEYSMSLGIPREIAKPVMPTYEYEGSNSSFLKSICSILKLIFGIVLLVIGVLCCIEALFSGCSFGQTILELLFGVPVTIGGASMLADLGNSRRQKIEAESQYAIDMSKYDASMAQYERELSYDRERIERENREKNFLNCEIRYTELRLAESEKRLQEMYDMGIVYPKYRNMIMINSICEYLKSGRCSSLEGSTGAYNILENEMRLDRIILQLDRVIQRLDQIKQNQYMLYSAIRQGESIARDIAQSTKDISIKLDNILVENRNYTQELQNLHDTSRLATYNLTRINKELHYMNQMKYYAGEYNGTLFNQLP